MANTNLGNAKTAKNDEFYRLNTETNSYIK